MKGLRLYFLVVLSSCFSSCNSQDYDQLTNYNTPLDKLLDSLNIQESTLKIIIDKSDYKLTVKSNSSIIKDYPVVFGGNPIDDKLMQGDNCTPEGTFYTNSKYPHKSWSKFIWLNYPTKDSWKKHNKAKSGGTIPANAKIGGEIGIHGVPDGFDSAIDYKQNWTLGCISMKNTDVNELYPLISKYTEIIIQK